MSRRVTECKSAALPGAFPRNALKIVVSLLLMPSPLLGVSFTAAAGERIKYKSQCGKQECGPHSHTVRVQTPWQLGEASIFISEMEDSVARIEYGSANAVLGAARDGLACVCAHPPMPFIKQRQ